MRPEMSYFLWNTNYYFKPISIGHQKQVGTKTSRETSQQESLSYQHSFTLSGPLQLSTENKITKLLHKYILTLPAPSIARMQIFWPPFSSKCSGSTLYSICPPDTRTFFKFSCLNEKKKKKNSRWICLLYYTSSILNKLLSNNNLGWLLWKIK